MMIPPFAMPTKQSNVIQFNVPTVQVCIDYADLSPDIEQEIATGYLDRLNSAYDGSDKSMSSLYWTMQDRKAALYWIFLYVSDDTVMSTAYKCRCGETHNIELDLQDLAEQVTIGEIKKTEVYRTSGDIDFYITPLFGWAEQYLEEMRLHIDGEATVQQKADIKVMCTLLQVLPIEATKKSPQELIDHLIELKEKITISDYKQLSIDIQKYNKKHSFGLQLNVNSVGEVELLAPVFDCTNENKEVSANIQTRLRIPFRSYDYITKI
jgi:hypothetical protein